MNFVIRPIVEDDLDAVLELASQTGPGMTSLPADKELLEEKIQDSTNSFKIKPTKVGRESYRFVLELLDEKKIIGISAIRARVGGFEPFYSYEIKKARHQSKELEVDKEVKYLELCKEHDGPSIISSIFVSPDYRGKNYGKYLSQARFLFMANNPERFTETVIAEMRGYIDDNGKSPFWESTVRHFFDMDFLKADYLSVKDKGFIADLMPHYPIYIPLLRDEAIEAIGKVHKKTEPAMKFLESQNFERDDHVDIFDAGPRIACNIQNIKTVKESKIYNAKSQTGFSSDEAYLISNCDLDFRVSLCQASIQDNNNMLISEESEKLLNSSQNQQLRVCL